VIGNFLTEINVTSPTCARQILDQSGENPIQEYFEKL
jgi:Prokaryotic glutathione synthetase, ATP-grasp domain.